MLCITPVRVLIDKGACSCTCGWLKAFIPFYFVVSDGPICRICHEGGSSEGLLSPCDCTGTLGTVHKSCLEKWLSSSNTSYCELCHTEFSIERCPRPLTEVTKVNALCLSASVFLLIFVCSSWLYCCLWMCSSSFTSHLSACLLFITLSFLFLIDWRFLFRSLPHFFLHLSCFLFFFFLLLYILHLLYFLSSTSYSTVVTGPRPSQWEENAVLRHGVFSVHHAPSSYFGLAVSEGRSGSSSAGELAAGCGPYSPHHRPLHHLCPMDPGKHK